MKTPKQDHRCYQSKQQNNQRKPNNVQRKDVDPKIRTLARLVEYSYHRNPVSTVVVFALTIITTPIWYPIGLLIKYRQLIIVSIIMLALILIPIKVYDHYIGKPQRESVLIKPKEFKDKSSR